MGVADAPQPRLNPVHFLSLQVAASTFSGAAVRVAQPTSRNTRRSVVVRAEGTDLAKVTLFWSCAGHSGRRRRRQPGGNTRVAVPAEAAPNPSTAPLAGCGCAREGGGSAAGWLASS